MKARIFNPFLAAVATTMMLLAAMVVWNSTRVEAAPAYDLDSSAAVAQDVISVTAEPTTTIHLSSKMMMGYFGTPFEWDITVVPTPTTKYSVVVDYGYKKGSPVDAEAGTSKLKKTHTYKYPGEYATKACVYVGGDKIATSNMHTITINPHLKLMAEEPVVKLGEPVTVTAEVDPAAKGENNEVMMFRFEEEGDYHGKPISGTKVMTSYLYKKPGTYTITAKYEAKAYADTKAEVTTTVKVEKIMIESLMVNGEDKVTVKEGENVTFEAMTDAPLQPAMVNFKKGEETIGSAKLEGDKATFNVSATMELSGYIHAELTSDVYGAIIDSSHPVTVTVEADPLPNAITVSANPAEVVADGTSVSTVTAQLMKDGSEWMPTEDQTANVKFETSMGMLSASSVKANAEGQAMVTLTSEMTGTATVTATLADKSAVADSTTVNFTEAEEEGVEVGENGGTVPPEDEGGPTAEIPEGAVGEKVRIRIMPDPACESGNLPDKFKMLGGCYIIKVYKNNAHQPDFKFLKKIKIKGKANLGATVAATGTVIQSTLTYAQYDSTRSTWDELPQASDPTCTGDECTVEAQTDMTNRSLATVGATNIELFLPIVPQ
jgi:hypothetical protein